MGSRGKQSFSSTWVTQRQLGAFFNLSTKEVGQYLIELGLRGYNKERRAYEPTEKAFSHDLCTLTPLRNGTPFYMWHRAKVSQLLQEHASLAPLSVSDMNARATALDLIQAEKEAQEGNDKLYYLLFDSISPRTLPTVMAWALVMTSNEHDPIHQSILDSIDAATMPAINAELQRLNSPIRLGDDPLPNPSPSE